MPVGGFRIILTNCDVLVLGNLLEKHEAPSSDGFREEVKILKYGFPAIIL